MTRYWNNYLFESENHNNDFNKNGFFTLPFLNESECNEIANQLMLYKNTNSIFFHSRIHSNAEESRIIHDIINNFVAPKLYRIRIQDEYKIAGAVLVHKPPSEETGFGIHTDDSLCDERLFLPFNIWIPLVDVNNDNGTLNMIKSSHLYTSIFRGTTIHDKYVDNFKNNLNDEHQSIQLLKGSAVVYHPGCIHFSKSNLSNAARPAIVISCIPANATLNIFIQKKQFLFKRKILRFDIENNNFDFHSWDNKSYPNFNPVEIIDY